MNGLFFQAHVSDWVLVAEKLDHDGFFVPDSRALEILVTLFRLVTQVRDRFIKKLALSVLSLLLPRHSKCHSRRWKKPVELLPQNIRFATFHLLLILSYMSSIGTPVLSALPPVAGAISYWSSLWSLVEKY